MDKATIVTKVKVILPSRFLAKVTDPQIEAYIDLILEDINLVPPQTDYNITNAPAIWAQLIVFGCSVYTALFLHANYTLIDFNFSDGGLTLSPDRTTKLDRIHEKMYQQYYRNVTLAKRALIFKTKPQGIGSSIYLQGFGPSGLSQMLNLLYGVNWSQPNY